MNILLEQSGYPLANMGDLAMLETSVNRLRSLFPEAIIKVINSAPHKLDFYINSAQSINNAGVNTWLSPMSKSLLEFLPSSLKKAYLFHEWKSKINQPSIARRLIEYKYSGYPDILANLTDFLKNLEEADFVVATGGGYITDTFPNKANTTLGILGLAQNMNKPTFMLGHGIGPFNSKETVSKARLVLPGVRKITLREGLRGPSLLKSVGVSDDQIIVTGDDAIELSFKNRSERIGDGVGVNLRVASYSNITSDSLNLIKHSILEFAERKKAPLVPVPIEFIDHNSDVASIKKITDSYVGEVKEIALPESPNNIAKQVNYCRIVITGSYHAGVFSLSQGIPVVAIVRSQYYIDKFSGLFDQFGNVGGKILSLDSKNFLEEFKVAMDSAWNSPSKNRLFLLDKASQQIELGMHAYSQIKSEISFGRNISEL